MERKCLGCEKPLPPASAANLLYCNTNCRSRAYRLRHRPAPRAAKLKAPPPAAHPLTAQSPVTPPPSAPPAAAPKRPSHATLQALRTEILQALAQTEQRLLERARELDALAMQRSAAQLLESRKQAEALAEAARRAQALAAAESSAKTAAPMYPWPVWLPAALSVLPALLQASLLLWDRRQTRAGAPE